MCTIKSFHAKELYRNQSRLTANQQVIASINIILFVFLTDLSHLHSLAIVGDQLIDIESSSSCNFVERVSCGASIKPTLYFDCVRFAKNETDCN